MAKKPRQERERQKERSRVSETRRGVRGESEEKGKQRGRERRSASGFFFGSNQERTKSRATVPRVRDRSNFFFLHASIHGYSLARIPCPRCCEQAPAFSSQSGTSRTRYCLCQRDSSRSTRFQPLYRVSSLYRRWQLLPTEPIYSA